MCVLKLLTRPASKDIYLFIFILKMTLEAETLITVSADGQLFEGLCPTNLDELEKASVLASTGNLHSKESLKLKDLDLIDVPLNTVNSLTKMIRGDLEFNNVTGMHYSTFDEIKCDTLLVCDMSIPGPLTQEINVVVWSIFGKLSKNRRTIFMN